MYVSESYSHDCYVQAGVVLETLDSALADQGMMVPLDLGAKVLTKYMRQKII